MPASRVTVNTPTTHGAIGFSTALPPSMTLGCGSWGGNVTSDNVSPLHLMDIKRVAFETRPVASKRPAVAAQTVISPAAGRPAPLSPPPSATPKVSREEIAAIVDRFLANRPAEAPLPSPPAQASDYAPPQSGNGGGSRPTPPAAGASTNGHRAADFVSEDDVRRAIQKGEKIYVGPKTIITPSARDMGEPAEIFAKA
jgi:acetaldehyde dehydrogenase (acetylating)